MAKPQMTSLVDVLTVLVFFLLKNFSTEGDIVTQSKNLELPMSSSKAARADPDHRHQPEAHLGGGRPGGPGERRNGSAAGPDIPSLSRFLDDRRKQTEQISEYDQSVKFDGKLTIQGDNKIPYWLLQKVLSTCGENGYSSFSLAVMKPDVD